MPLCSYAARQLCSQAAMQPGKYAARQLCSQASMQYAARQLCRQAAGQLRSYAAIAARQLDSYAERQLG